MAACRPPMDAVDRSVCYSVPIISNLEILTGPMKPAEHKPTARSRMLRDESGATLIMFAGLFAVLAMTIGVGLDYARAFAVQSSLQRDLDAAILAGAMQASEDGLDAETISEKYFGDNWTTLHKSGSVTVSVTESEGKIKAAANVPVPMTLMRIAGFTDLTVDAKSAVSFGGRDVEMALVLDTTKSMSGQKLDDLKAAATKLIETAYKGPDADKYVKVALVPFAQYVNVGLANRNAVWMDVAPDSTTTEQQCGDVTPIIGQSNCRTETATAYDDGTPYTYEYQTCDYQYGPPEYQCNDVTKTYTWNGCAGSRTYPLNTRDEQYTNRVPGIMNVSCSSELQPLTNDKSLLTSKIQAMVAKQETYIPSGLAWGWRVLSKIKPFSEGLDKNATTNGRRVRKMLVLMSDGANTKSPKYPDHTATQVSEADSLTVELCSNIKADGIEIFTVAFDITDSSVIEKMRGCASDLSNFFQTATGVELEQAFQTIAHSTRSVSLSE